ncbi:hypothetical protein THASP1DRAFT_22451 [Thamnocephalis sphaerospora]|uniref:F-box domain-containing protein n=1 Tax=Thamnocephalis sphaerospora TaxID=78915 RepID=A0A4P9XUU8_9FUNG|nr:hypothetical protein THASP1DRAFT_22451 [Thamnocephalis sphaerospora]|eukprot:RKP09752.1 hypothetical protein THASP1DRAFT_22451 [Thamnocephalis sphaerospora]
MAEVGRTSRTAKILRFFSPLSNGAKDNRRHNDDSSQCARSRDRRGAQLKRSPSMFYQLMASSPDLSHPSHSSRLSACVPPAPRVKEQTHSYDDLLGAYALTKRCVSTPTLCFPAGNSTLHNSSSYDTAVSTHNVHSTKRLYSQLQQRSAVALTATAGDGVTDMSCLHHRSRNASHVTWRAFHRAGGEEHGASNNGLDLEDWRAAPWNFHDDEHIERAPRPTTEVTTSRVAAVHALKPTATSRAQVLPLELIVAILSHLDRPKDMRRAQQTCRQWRGAGVIALADLWRHRPYAGMSILTFYPADPLDFIRPLLWTFLFIDREHHGRQAHVQSMLPAVPRTSSVTVTTTENQGRQPVLLPSLFSQQACASGGSGSGHPLDRRSFVRMVRKKYPCGRSIDKTTLKRVYEDVRRQPLFATSPPCAEVDRPQADEGAAQSPPLPSTPTTSHNSDSDSAFAEHHSPPAATAGRGTCAPLIAHRRNSARRVQRWPSASRRVSVRSRGIKAVATAAVATAATADLLGITKKTSLHARQPSRRRYAYCAPAVRDEGDISVSTYIRPRAYAFATDSDGSLRAPVVEQSATGHSPAGGTM